MNCYFLYDLCEYSFLDQHSDSSKRLFKACLMGRHDLVKWIIHKEEGDVPFFLAFEGACQGGHRWLVEWMIDKGVDDDWGPVGTWDWGLQGACQGGHLDLAEWMIQLGADPDYGLYGACLSGHPHIANRMIRLGANDWSNSLVYACQAENQELIELMIQKGVRNGSLNEGFKYVCQKGNQKLVEWMIQKGADDWNAGLRIACQFGRRKIAERMIQLGATSCINKYHYHEQIQKK